MTVAVDNVMTPVFCLLSGLLQGQLGPRLTLMLTCLPYLAGWGVAALGKTSSKNFQKFSGIFTTLVSPTPPPEIGKI